MTKALAYNENSRFAAVKSLMTFRARSERRVQRVLRRSDGGKLDGAGEADPHVLRLQVVVRRVVVVRQPLRRRAQRQAERRRKSDTQC